MTADRSVRQQTEQSDIAVGVRGLKKEKTTKTETERQKDRET